MSLQGRGAVVTGGGRGIGAETARRLAAAGCRIVVSARSAAEIEAVASELQEAGHEAWAVPCDVSEPAQVVALGEAATERLGTVEILVNNAGFAHSAPLKAISLDDWNRLLAVNLTGVFLCTQAMTPGMIARGWGRVVNIASIAGKMGAPYIAAYCASKHGVVGFTRAIAAELAMKGVTVNAVCPGYVDTPMTVESVTRIVETTGADKQGVEQAIRGMSPQNRMMEPGEIAHLVVSLCAEEAKGINGQAIVLDGGAVQS